MIAWLLAHRWTRWLGVALAAVVALAAFIWRIRKDAVDDEHARQNEDTLDRVRTIEEKHRELDGSSPDEKRERLKRWAD